jgi:hypothetical protein
MKKHKLTIHAIDTNSTKSLSETFLFDDMDEFHTVFTDWEQEIPNSYYLEADPTRERNPLIDKIVDEYDLDC